MRFVAPANILLRRAQLVLMLAALLPTVLMTALGIILLASGSESIAIVVGVLVLAFCTSSVTGYILGSIFVSRGASLARVQHDFLSAVSHELRTPLTSMRMFIDTLRDDRVSDPAERARCLSVIDQELIRLSALVERLLELSRVETGRKEFARGDVDIAAMVADALKAFEGVTVGGQLELAVEVEPGLRVRGDRPALAAALLNLLTNAWKYTPPDGKRISIEARSAGERHIELVVADNGPGIPDEEQAHIFDYFKRGKAAVDSRVVGSGLGLALVRAVVRAHRGRIELHRAEGGGARFCIQLPRGATVVR